MDVYTNSYTTTSCRYHVLQWRDPKGKLRKWESAERNTRAACGVDGVAIIAHVTGGGGPSRVILESQFRPPQGNVCIEVRMQRQAHL
jgi:ADP-ribose pyrophosphatase